MTKNVAENLHKMTRDLPSIPDRILSGLTYMTAGTVGVVWLIVATLRGTMPSRFGLYHIMQSIFVSLCYVIINWLFWTIADILALVPFINRLTRQVIYIFNSPLVFGYSIMQCFIYGTLIYLTVFAFMGLYAYLPFFSDVIKSHFRD